MRFSPRLWATAVASLGTCAAVTMLVPTASGASTSPRPGDVTVQLTWQIRTSASADCGPTQDCITDIGYSPGIDAGAFLGSELNQKLPGLVSFDASRNGFTLSDDVNVSGDGIDDAVTQSAILTPGTSLTGVAAIPDGTTVTVQARVGQVYGPTLQIGRGHFTIPLTTGVGAARSRIEVTATPHDVRSGSFVRISGTAPDGCIRGDAVTLLSRAFSDQYSFAGLPAVYANVDESGTFSVFTEIPRGRRPGTYAIIGRCDGGALGTTAELRVLAP